MRCCVIAVDARGISGSAKVMAGDSLRIPDDWNGITGTWRGDSKLMKSAAASDNAVSDCRSGGFNDGEG